MTNTQGLERATLNAASARRALSLFFLSGVLMSFLGAILPAWGYHIKVDFSEVGHYFLAVNLGMLASVPMAPKLVARWGNALVLIGACGLACAAFLLLALTGPPAPWSLRLVGMTALGFSTGVLNRGVFHAISPIYRHDPAATVNLAGAMFGFGCFLTAMLVAGTFEIYTAGSILFLIALIPGFFAGILARSPLSEEPVLQERSLREVWPEFKNPGAVLFTLLLFFQFGNEWSVAGWLPIFLIQRLGVSPAASLVMLAVYWLALMLGRIVAQSLLPRVPHGRLLMGSVLAAMLGSIMLMLTNNKFGGYAGILILGSGFAMIYPLVVEKIGRRFPYYHPGFFNGILSFAITGGMLAPWILGFFADLWGVRVVMGLPLVGTFMVFILLLLLMLESKLSGVEA